MRIIVYGAGGIGSIVGGNLARNGHDVILIARPGHAQAINELGLKLITPNGTHIVRVPAVSSPAEIAFKSDDVAFLTMKSQQTEEALNVLKACVDDIPVFCLQNSVRNEETASHLFRNVYAVTVRIGAVFLNPGEVVARMDPPGWLIIGRYPEGLDALADQAAEKVRSAGFIVKLSSNVMRYKWGKVMNNIGSAVGAITNAARADCLEIAACARSEFKALLEEAGIAYVTDADIAREWPEFTIKAPNYSAGEAQSSTWQSLARKQGSVENEYFNGEVVRVARRLGREAPINGGLNRIMQEMAANREIPGKYTIQELEHILGLK